MALRKPPLTLLIGTRPTDNGFVVFADTADAIAWLQTNGAGQVWTVDVRNAREMEVVRERVHLRVKEAETR